MTGFQVTKRRLILFGDYSPNCIRIRGEKGLKTSIPLDTWFSGDNLNISWLISILLYNKVSNHKREVGIDCGGNSLNCLRIKGHFI